MPDAEMRKPQPMPPPSAELVLITVMVQAHLSTLSRKQRLAFLRNVSKRLVEQEEFGNVLRFRPKSDDEALAKARRGASEWFRRALGLFVSV